ncbi:C-terminal binding protein [Paenibacillus sp.]|uniref:C-terminal binding protein n=1 Tax=Paenibacillus sp. TaxID=58172 RepID=UPI002D381888|nr:C-terminal binding protein [Paenibacillus sp.]HZG58095.1 C-terminal binding protein [Paenibacillus sp.]
MYKVIITDSAFSTDGPERKALEKHGCTLVRFQCATEEQLIEAGSGAKAALVQYARITRRVLEAWPDCEIIVRYGIGYDNVDIAAAAELGIQVCNVPSYCLDEVADHTSALLLAALRKIVPFHRGVKQGVWDVEKIARPMQAFGDTKIGLLGFGRIAVRVAERLLPYRFQIMTFDPYANRDTAERMGVRVVGDLETLLKEADAVSLHVPLTDETRHLMNERTISLMKPTALLVNTSRGALIDSLALANALKERRLGGAALDVVEHEPLPLNHPLASCENAIFTPHAAYYSERSIERLQYQAAEEIVRWKTGEPLLSPVTLMKP